VIRLTVFTQFALESNKMRKFSCSRSTASFTEVFTLWPLNEPLKNSNSSTWFSSVVFALCTELILVFGVPHPNPVISCIQGNPFPVDAQLFAYKSVMSEKDFYHNSCCV